VVGDSFLLFMFILWGNCKIISQGIDEIINHHSDIKKAVLACHFYFIRTKEMLVQYHL
jgi:hypothetical protein